MRRDIFIIIWYLFVSLCFIIFISIMYFSNTNQEILLNLFVIFLIFVFISSIPTFFVYSYIIQDYLPYLKSSVFIKAYFYVFSLIVGSIYLKSIVPLGFVDVISELLLSFIFTLLLISFLVDFKYVENHFSSGEVSKEYIAKSQVFYLFIVILNYISFLFCLNLSCINLLLFVVLPIIPLGGDCILIASLIRLEKYWKNVNNLQFSSSNSLYSSIFLSSRFYMFFIIPMSLICIPISFLYCLNFQFYIPFLFLKIILISKFFHILYKAKEKEVG